MLPPVHAAELPEVWDATASSTSSSNLKEAAQKLPPLIDFLGLSLDPFSLGMPVSCAGLGIPGCVNATEYALTTRSDLQDMYGKSVIITKVRYSRIHYGTNRHCYIHHHSMKQMCSRPTNDHSMAAVLSAAFCSMQSPCACFALHAIPRLVGLPLEVSAVPRLPQGSHQPPPSWLKPAPQRPMQCYRASPTWQVLRRSSTTTVRPLTGLVPLSHAAHASGPHHSR